MSGDVRERPKVVLDDGDDALDLSDFAAPEETPAPTAAEIASVSKEAGFVSRSPSKPVPRRRRGKRSPFQIALAIKTRPGMRELFQDIGDLLDTHDHTTFERALKALIIELGDKDLLKEYEKLTTSD